MSAKAVNVHSEKHVIITVDRNERQPFTFQKIVKDKTAQKPGQSIFEVVTTERKVLECGDYCISGFPHVVLVERKTIKELFQCVTTEREWFRTRQVERMSVLSALSFVVCEGSVHQLEQPQAKTVVRTMMSWCRKYPNVHWYFGQDRREAELFTFRLLQQAHKDIEDVYNKTVDSKKS